MAALKWKGKFYERLGSQLIQAISGKRLLRKQINRQAKHELN